MLSTLATQSFNILRLIARNPIFLSLSLSLERALSSEIGSQDPCSARSAAPELQHFMLLCLILAS